MKCRHCGAEATLQLVDLGSAPPSNAYLTRAALRAPEAWYPLRVLVCERCWLVQTEDFVDAEALFSADYAYFSAYSSSWLAHSEQYVAAMVARRLAKCAACAAVIALAVGGSYGSFWPRSTSAPVTRQSLSPPGQRILWNSRYRPSPG